MQNKGVIQIVKEDLIGYKWSLDVVEGKEIANKYIKLECKRYIDRLNDIDKDIEFDFKEAEIIYNLLYVINYATGFYANEPIISHIHGFQAMVLENLFCLFWKERDNLGNRKKVIEECYLEIGRKAGKSFLSGLINLMLMLRAERYSQFACAGKTREISALVRNAVVELINSSPTIRKHFKITRDKITCKLNDSYMLHLSGEADNLLGKLLTAYTVDECANMQDSGVIDALKLSQMNTKTRMAVYISTQFEKPINAFNDLIDYHKKILDGRDDTDARNTFGLLFELDEGDDFKDERNWNKCNPLQMGLENGRKFLRGEYKKGLVIESAMNKFRTYILNERLNNVGGESFIDYELWKKGEGKVDFTGKEVVLGVDLSIAIDLSSINATYREGDKYYSMSWGFLGRDSLTERREKFDYIASEKRGECFINEGRIVDYGVIKDFILNFEDKYKCTVKCLVTDPFNALDLMQEIDKNSGFKVIFLKQTYSNLSPATKAMQLAVIQGKYIHCKSKLYDLHMVDTQLSVGKSGDVMIDKASTRKKKGAHIDLIATSIFSMTQLYLNKKKKRSWDNLENGDFVC